MISYDAPSHFKTYVHRVGRTARAGKKGTAYTLLKHEEVCIELCLIIWMLQTGTLSYLSHVCHTSVTCLSHAQLSCTVCDRVSMVV